MLHHDLTAPQMSKPSPRPAISFSAVGVVGLCLFCLFGMFALQIIGVYIGSLAYYEQAGSLNVATLIMLGSNNGVVVAISVFITALAFTLFAVGWCYLKAKRHATAHPISPHQLITGGSFLG